MKKLFAVVVFVGLMGCAPRPTSDDVQRAQSETILAEGTSAVGMPAIKNFRERKLAKDILEMRDQADLVTYTYLENMIPTVVPGHTALGGKYTFFAVTVGFGLPYASQFTNPEKIVDRYEGDVAIPQADPNGLFAPESAAATWIMVLDPKTKKVTPQYIESNLTVLTFRLPLD